MSLARRLASAAVVLMLAGLAPLLVPAPSAAEEPHWPGEEGQRARAARSCAPLGPTCLDIEGRGYGHGRGMSQYGARDAAERGRTWPQILGFYYPGIGWGTYRGALRVLITADTDTDTVVHARDGLTVYDHYSKTARHLPTHIGAVKWRLDTRADGWIRISYFTTYWRGYQLIRSIGEFRAPGPIALETPGGVRRYRGHLRYVAWQQPAGKRTVNVLTMDDYLKGVVPREMPALWHGHAVRAQAVAARTYALHERQARLGKPWEICDTTSCQVYGGYDDEHPASNDAIARTVGRYLTYGGKPAFAQFSASSGGYTVAGDFPYLVARHDPYDGYPTWRVTGVDARPLAAGRGIGTLQRVAIVARDGNGSYGGRVTALRLTGSEGTVNISGNDARWILGLKSTMFVLR